MEAGRQIPTAICAGIISSWDLNSHTPSLSFPMPLTGTQFFELFVLPLYSGLTSVLPAMEPLYQQVQRNHQMWLETEASNQMAGRDRQ